MIDEVGGIDDDDDRVGQPLAGLRAGDDVARHALVGRRRLEAVCAWQVEQFDRAAIVERHPAGVTLDRDSWIIAHLYRNSLVLGKRWASLLVLMVSPFI